MLQACIKCITWYNLWIIAAHIYKFYLLIMSVWIQNESILVLRKIFQKIFLNFVFEFEKQEHSKNDGTLESFQSNAYTLKLSEAIITGDNCELCTCPKSPGPLGVAVREKRHKRGLRQLYRSYNPPLTTLEKELRTAHKPDWLNKSDLLQESLRWDKNRIKSWLEIKKVKKL